MLLGWDFKISWLGSEDRAGNATRERGEQGIGRLKHGGLGASLTAGLRELRMKGRMVMEEAKCQRSSTGSMRGFVLAVVSVSSDTISRVGLSSSRL